MKLHIVVSYHNNRWQARTRILSLAEAKKKRVDLKAQNRQYLEWNIEDAPKDIVDYLRNNDLYNQVIIMNSKRKKNYIFSGIILNMIYQKYKDDTSYLVKVCNSIDGEIFYDNSLSTMLDNIKAERKARGKAHAAFDPIWKNGHMERTEAYWWLSLKMKIEILYCHIGLFDIYQCQEVIHHCEEYIQQLKRA